MRRTLIPVKWYINGRTALRNLPYRKYEQQRMPKGGGATGSYTMRRTWRKAKAVLAAQGKAGKYLYSYLITHTMPAEYTNEERRSEWRRFIDRFRKENPTSYVWITEVHTGTRGTSRSSASALGRIHHHMVVSFPSVWWYSKLVRRWSWAYCGSSNGLDIRPVRRGAASYLAKYLCKGLFDEPRKDRLTSEAGKTDVPSLPFRWWGSSGVPTSGITWIEAGHVDWCAFQVKWYNASHLWVPQALVTAWSASAVLNGVQQGLTKLNEPRSELPATFALLDLH